MTTQGEVATCSGAPSDALLTNGASMGVASMSSLRHFQWQKKTRKDFPGGFVDNVRTLLLVGTIAIRTHAPLARHMFYVFFHVDWLDVLAHYVGDIKAHFGSRSNRPEKVKF
jgi:hypothetical protein